MEKLPHNLPIRKIWITISLLLSVASLYISAPQSDEILRQIETLVVTTFSFLAGFLIAAIAVVGYSTEVVARHGWEVATIHRESFKIHLERYALHFVLYLVAIIFMIFMSFIKSPIPEALWMISSFVCTFALMMSFSLPYEIIKQHISIYDAVIEKAKKDKIEADASNFKN